MINDEQGREWLLQKLYDAGWRYIVVNNHKDMFLSIKNPYAYDKYKVTVSDCNMWLVPRGFKEALPKLNLNEVLNIAMALGIVDWSKVPVDTPILVKNHDGEAWEKRYFAFFEDGNIYAWMCGTTSWTADVSDGATDWKYAKLAGDTDE